MGKRSPDIYDCLIKCQPLTLVNGNSPSQLQRILPECALYFFGNLFGLFVQCITGIGPILRLHSQNSTCLQTADFHVSRSHSRHLTYGTVHVPVFSTHVVLHKHHLRSLLQFQHLLRRIKILGKFAFNLCFKNERTPRQLLQFTVIHPLCLIIMGNKPDISLLFRWIEPRQVTAV